MGTPMIDADDERYPDEWTPEQRALFVKAYRFLVTSQKAVTHPDATPIPDAHWHTIAHNAAWTLVDLAANDELTVHELGSDTVLATTVVGPAH